MAKTAFIDVPPELEEQYNSDLQSMDRFILPRMKPKLTLLSKRKLTNITNRAYLPQVASLWAGFSDAQRQAWKDADPRSQQHGWRLFLADQSRRINQSLAGVVVPSSFHQDMVGQLLIEAPASELKLLQNHPASYFVYQKIEGKKSMFVPSEVNESFSLPLVLSISFKSDLTATDSGAFARFYATIRHLYQGQNLSYDLIVDMPLQFHWDKIEMTVSSLIGLAVSYDLYIHLFNVTGELLIDNPKAVHSGSNWVRDTFCEQIERVFTRGFSLIPQSWSPLILPTGATYQSIYHAEALYEASVYGLKLYGVPEYGVEE